MARLAPAAGALACLLQRPRLCRKDDRTWRDLYEDFGVKRATLMGGAVRPEAMPGAFREGNDEDLQRIRDMRGELIKHDANPGLRVEPNFIDEHEEQELAAEFRQLVHRFGFCFKAEMVEVQSMGAEGLRSHGQNHSKRVTGRPETRDDQRGVVAPWGYGADLDTSQLPQTVQKILARLRDRGYRFGPLRDCTINHRTGSFFMIHPHIDPLPDGPNVFVLGLLSGAVLTFTPDSMEHRRGLEVEQRSWSDQDLDVLLRRRSLCGFTGAARYAWRHGIRGGMELQAPELPKPTVCDFWGSMKYILPRREERFSLALAFADP